MKACFRTIAAFSTSEMTALPVAGLLVLVLVLYTDFAIPMVDIVGALRWITYVNVSPSTCPLVSVLISRRHSLSVTRSNP